jgi:hypothetical protein
MLGWPNHPRGCGRPPFFFLFCFVFFKIKKSARGILGINRPNELNCHNLKVFFGGGGGDKVSYFKL